MKNGSLCLYVSPAWLLMCLFKVNNYPLCFDLCAPEKETIRAKRKSAATIQLQRIGIYLFVIFITE